MNRKRGAEKRWKGEKRKRKIKNKKLTWKEITGMERERKERKWGTEKKRVTIKPGRNWKKGRNGKGKKGKKRGEK